jgi:hypothetical protein
MWCDTLPTAAEPLANVGDLPAAECADPVADDGGEEELPHPADTISTPAAIIATALKRDLFRLPWTINPLHGHMCKIQN